jgi:hypothetical protein
MTADDLARMDDPEFLRQRRRLHDALGEADATDDLAEQYQAYELEFLRRAGLSTWKVCA